MLFTFYHMVLFQVITRRRIPSSHQEEMGWNEGPTCHLSVARQTLITQVSSLSHGECSAWIPVVQEDEAGLLSGRSRGRAALAKLEWLQLLWNPLRGWSVANQGCAAIQQVSSKSQHCSLRGWHGLQDLGLCLLGPKQLILKLPCHHSTVQI